MYDDIRQLDNLRASADLHHIDRQRAKLVVHPDGGYDVVLPAPVVPLGPWAESVPERRTHARSAEGAEFALLDGLIKLCVAERRRIRIGSVVGWSGDQINRTPLTDAEIAAFEARTNPANKVAELEAELAAALREQAARTAAAQAAADLANRYNVTTPRTPAKPKPGTTAISGKPTKRANRKEVNSHE
ncbi:hypothetical protein [Pseudomonas sp. NPDC089401]|uniref:hypothetical protein n=1 Tax=Pseudomonas sp. NPDC089401 TaxID=3364462 RepID=UPI00381A5623